MARFKLWRPFAEWSPVMKAATFTALATLTVLLHQIFMINPPNTKEVLSRWHDNVLQSWTDMVEFVIITPFKEEALYRWPSLLLLAALFQQIIKREPVRRETMVAAAYAASIATMIAMTAFWAKDHDYPITVFSYGVIWGLLMFVTKNPFYSWLFHSVCNLIAVGIIAIGYKALCT